MHRTAPPTPRSRRGSRRHWRVLASVTVLASALAVSGCSAGNEGVTTLDFFQFKPEAVGDFTEIIADFEEANPDIRVVQNAVPDADTAIRTLLVKNKVPDVLTLNTSGNFGELARACVFADLGGMDATNAVNPAVQDIVQALSSCDDGGGEEINALPFASNASGIIYNPDIFAENNVEVPTTWDELLTVADTFRRLPVPLL
jgi:raffinose/stachyose/melibiose transport system substrate-binding protein